MIGTFLGVLLFAVIVGELASGFTAAFPKMTTHGLTTISAILGGFLGICWQRFINDVHANLIQHLKVGERIAPYFGHKITRTIHILRG